MFLVEELLVQLDDMAPSGHDTSSPNHPCEGRDSSSGGERGTYSPQPRVGRIISLEDEGMALEEEYEEEEEEELSVLVHTHFHPDSEQPKPKREFKPVRPAPPKPRPYKPSPERKAGSEGGVASDETTSPISHSDVAPILSTKTNTPSR